VAAGVPRVLLASESPVIVAGLRVLLGREVDVAGVALDLDRIAARARVAAADTVLVAPVTGLPDELEPLLAGELAGVRAFLLLSPTGVRIHSAVMRSAVDNRALPLTVGRREILGALRGADRGARIAVPDGASKLSRREQEVLDHLASGASNSDIADRMSLSVDTVKSHLTRVYRKLGVRRRAEAITAYLEVT
jgi:DNA-binding CsgD family transcriptional regulator